MTDAPANVLRFVKVLGEQATLDFLMEFGGTPVYLAPNPQPGSALVKCLGYEQARTLGRKLGPASIHVPSAKPWVAERLDAKGWTGVQIARALHCDNRSVRRWLNGRSDHQLDFFHQAAAPGGPLSDD